MTNGRNNNNNKPLQKYCCRYLLITQHNNMERIRDILAAAATKARGDIQQRNVQPPPQLQVPATMPPSAPLATLAAATSSSNRSGGGNSFMYDSLSMNKMSSEERAKARMEAQLVMMQQNLCMSHSLKDAILQHQIHLRQQEANGADPRILAQGKLTIDMMGLNLEWLQETNHSLWRSIQEDNARIQEDNNARIQEERRMQNQAQLAGQQAAAMVASMKIRNWTPVNTMVTPGADKKKAARKTF